jgi:hypothetical protein
MRAHRIRVVVPENHRVVVDIPESIPPGPVDLIVIAPPRNETERRAEPEAQGRMAALAKELAKDQRPFRELSLAERGARLEMIMGSARGLMSTSEELADSRLDAIYDLLETSFESGEADVAARHDEHQP